MKKKIHFACDVISTEFPSGLAPQENSEWPANGFRTSLCQKTILQRINLSGALFDFFVSCCPDHEAALKRGRKNLRLWLKKMRVIFEFQFQRCPSTGIGEIHTWNVY